MSKDKSLIELRKGPVLSTMDENFTWTSFDDDLNIFLPAYSEWLDTVTQMKLEQLSPSSGNPVLNLREMFSTILKIPADQIKVRVPTVSANDKTVY